MNPHRTHSSRLYLVAPNLYATSRKAWDSWQSLTSSERRRYLGLARRTNRRTGRSNQSRAVRVHKL